MFWEDSCREKHENPSHILDDFGSILSGFPWAFLETEIWEYFKKNRCEKNCFLENLSLGTEFLGGIFSGEAVLGRRRDVGNSRGPSRTNFKNILETPWWSCARILWSLGSLCQDVWRFLVESAVNSSTILRQLFLNFLGELLDVLRGYGSVPRLSWRRVAGKAMQSLCRVPNHSQWLLTQVGIHPKGSSLGNPQEF